MTDWNATVAYMDTLDITTTREGTKASMGKCHLPIINTKKRKQPNDNGKEWSFQQKRGVTGLPQTPSFQHHYHIYF